MLAAGRPIVRKFRVMEAVGSAELDALRLSLEVATRSVAFSLPLAVLAAWTLTRARFPGRWCSRAT